MNALASLFRSVPGLLVLAFAIFCGIKAYQSLADLPDEVSIVDLAARRSQAHGAR
jgi:predicted CoA-binding protein